MTGPARAAAPGLVFKLGSIGLKTDLKGLVETVVSAAVFFLPLSAYLLTLAPTIYNLDSAELTVAAATGGLMRATGYPLYLLIGRFWSLIPIGDVGFRMNLFSAVCGALGVWLAYRIMRKLEVSPLAAAGAAGLLAAAPFYWSLSLVAEVYTLQVVLMAGLILLLLRWAEEPAPARLAMAAGWTGLSFGHHLATALLVPGIVFFILSRARKEHLRPRTLAAAAAAALAGLCVYLYLPILHAGDPVFNYSGSYDAALDFHPIDLRSVSGMTWLVTGKSFAAQMFAYGWAPLWEEVVWFIGHLGRAFLYIGIGPGLVGLAALLRRDRSAAGMLALMFALSAFFYIDYAVVDKETMFLPTYLVWAVFAGLGYQALANRIGVQDPAWVRGLLGAAILSAVVVAAAVTGPAVDLSGDRTTRLLATGILDTVRQGAVVFGWWNTIPPVQYLQLIEDRRPDVTAVNRFLISREDLYEFVRREAENRPIYIDAFPSEWEGIFRPVRVGGLYRLEPIVPGSGEGYRSDAR